MPSPASVPRPTSDVQPSHCASVPPRAAALPHPDPPRDRHRTSHVALPPLSAGKANHLTRHDGTPRKSEITAGLITVRAVKEAVCFVPSSISRAQPGVWSKGSFSLGEIVPVPRISGRRTGERFIWLSVLARVVDEAEFPAMMELPGGGEAAGLSQAPPVHPAPAERAGGMEEVTCAFISESWWMIPARAATARRRSSFGAEPGPASARASRVSRSKALGQVPPWRRTERPTAARTICGSRVKERPLSPPFSRSRGLAPALAFAVAVPGTRQRARAAVAGTEGSIPIRLGSATTASDVARALNVVPGEGSLELRSR